MANPTPTLKFDGNGSIIGATSLPSKIITTNNLVSGSISFDNAGMISGEPTTLFTYSNSSGGINIDNNVTLTEAQAPLGSFVILMIDVNSGGHSGDQYLQVYQGSNSSSNPMVSDYVHYWFYRGTKMGFFPINTASDRTFYIHHGTVASSPDARHLRYRGYIKLQS